MKKHKNNYAVSFAFVVTLLLLSSFKNEKPKNSVNRYEDQCSEWTKIGTTQIQYRWCKDPKLFNETVSQFYNGYVFKIWYYFEIYYTNGEKKTGNNILDPDTQSYKASMYKKIPERFVIIKKQKQDVSGKWVEF